MKKKNIIVIFIKIKEIGLKDQFYRVEILINDLKCKYGWLKQIPKHVILLYPLYIN